jgi:hypothetical protein
VSQWEREVIGERTKDAMQALKASGRVYSRGIRTARGGTWAAQTVKNLVLREEVPCRGGRFDYPKRPLQSRGYAACCTGSSLVCMPGYHWQNKSRRSPFNTWVRTWRSRWAPRFVHFICCCFTNRLLIT